MTESSPTMTFAAPRSFNARHTPSMKAGWVTTPTVSGLWLRYTKLGFTRTLLPFGSTPLPVMISLATSQTRVGSYSFCSYRNTFSICESCSRVRPPQREDSSQLGERNLLNFITVSYTHLRAHETRHDLV